MATDSTTWMRTWAETAEAITLANGGSVLAWKIQEPTQRNGTNNNPNAAEQAWHYFLGGLDSGFMYYGTALDDEVKQTLAANRALDRLRPRARQANRTRAGELCETIPSNDPGPEQQAHANELADRLRKCVAKDEHL